MKHSFPILAALCLLAAPAAAQTMKALAYNTNGQVIYTATNTLTFTNSAVNIKGIADNGVVIFDVLNSTFYTGVTFTELVELEKPLTFFGTNAATAASTTRSNLSLGLPALTNTSNVTMMRALAGTTNSTEPFSGSFVFVDDAANTWSATVSNGIILSIIEQ